jgi:membrane protease YdiL (CAAX protease family)
MNIRTIFQNENRDWRSGWRIVAMVVLLAIVGVVVNVGWKALGLPGQKTGGPWMFLLFASLIAGLSFAGMLRLLRSFEKCGADAIWMSFTSRAWRETAAGTLLGVVPICLLMGLAVVAGYGSVGRGNLGVADLLPSLSPMIGAGFLLAAWEEFTLRGYLLRQLSIGINRTAAVVLTGMLFGLLHSGNPGANWEGLLYTAIGGILMALLVFRSGSLWLVIGYHFGWNAAAYSLFGLELSGMEGDKSIFTSSLSGADWLTGGSYGFEASLPALVFEVLVLLVALRLIKQKGSEPYLQKGL